MESISKDEIKRIQGYYLQKYGESIDPTTAMLLNEVQEIKKSSLVEREMTLRRLTMILNPLKTYINPFLQIKVRLRFCMAWANSHGLG